MHNFEYKKVLIQNSSGDFVKMPVENKSVEAEKNEFYWKLTKSQGLGETRLIYLRKGLSVAIMNCTLYRPLITKLKNESPGFGLRFSLSGKSKLNLNCLTDKLDVKGGENGFFSFPEMSGTSEESARENICRIMIHIQPWFFNEFLREELSNIPNEIKKLIRKKTTHPFNITDKVTPQMQAAIRQIIDCPYNGLSRRFFIESKVMELLAYRLEQFKIQNNDRQTINSALKPDDLERVYQAENYLSKNIQTAPDLVELSRATGMSRTKLLNCFGRVFGTSPAGYIRTKRLEKARELLEEGKINVTEAAYSVGYSNLSHFSEVFKNYYGILPSHFIKNFRL